MRHPVSLTVLLPTLLGGCGIIGGTSCGPTRTFDEEETYEVSHADLLAALDANGELTPEGCEDLCRSAHWLGFNIDEIHRCDVVFDDAVSAPMDLDTSHTGDTGVGPVHLLTCAWTESSVCEGRAHAALVTRAEGMGPTPLAAWLARAAHAEAASVKAFVSIGLELEAHGAPAALVARCREAARQEVAHARAVGALATARGGHPLKPRFGATPERSLLALAIENVQEGCVRETWSALVALWQATHATDLGVRGTMAAIAGDEAAHGDLAQAIHEWAMARLDPDGQAQVRAARHRAVASLFDGLQGAPDPMLERQAGLPDVPTALRLARRLTMARWSEPAAA